MNIFVQKMVIKMLELFLNVVEIQQMIAFQLIIQIIKKLKVNQYSKMGLNGFVLILENGLLKVIMIVAGICVKKMDTLGMLEFILDVAVMIIIHTMNMMK